MPRSSGSVWEHFLIISENGGKKHVTCNYCNVQYKSAQATRLKEHVLKCNNCPIEVKKTFRSEKSNNRANITPISALSPASRSSTSKTTDLASASTSNAITTYAVKKSSTPSDLESSTCENFSVSHGDIDTVVARAIYASGVPLSLLESEYWKDVFKVLNPSYTVPSIHDLSNTLLEAEYMRIKNEILTKSMALGLICDGWTNVVGKGVINFIITTPNQFFYNAIYPETQRETGQFLSEKIIEIIEEVGPAKFVAVISDNAANMKAAWAIVKAKYPHIACVGCVSHALNLIYKDVFNITLFEEVLRNVDTVIRYIKSAHVILASFEKLQIEKYGRTSTSLKLFSKTRWSEAFMTIKSYKENREALELLACHETNVVLQVKSIILDGQLWTKVDEVVKVLEPMAKAISISENNTALLSDVPFIFNSLRQELTTELKTAAFLSEPDKNVLLSTIQKRKEFCVKPIHYAAHQLDPRYCGVCLSDEEISTVAEYLRQVAITSGIEVAKVLKEMAEFRLKENFFDDMKEIWTPVKELEPRIWWKTFASNLDIAKIAIKILSVPPSSTASERNWSLFSRTHNKIRNPLHNLRTVKLMSIRSNLRLFRREGIDNVTVSELSDQDGTDISDNECEITERYPL